jgi:DNA-binding CsgD family transcriptional regulator
VATWTFVGRESELGRVAAAVADPSGRGLIFGGPPGIGKSRLLREGVACIDSDRHLLLSASASAATAAMPLGGLSAALPPEQPAGTSAAGLLRWGMDALQRQAAGRPIILAVDDAHLLDPLSAALVGHVARSGHTTVLGTLRTGIPVPDPVRALWIDDLVDRLELGPLSVAETTSLLHEVLGGPVDSRSVDRLWELAQGNALLLRELVLAARAAGDLEVAYGVWRWTGRLELAPTLADVVDSRIGRLTPEIREVLELVSFGEPLGLPLLVKATDGTAVELAEERGLIRVARDDRRTTVRLGHPLYGEVIRQRCPLTRVRRMLADLAHLFEATGARRQDDLLRVAVWRLDSDTASDPGRLARAARDAFARYQLPLAARLGRAALANGGGYEAAEALATILLLTDQPAEAVRVLDAVADELTGAPQRARWIAVRGLANYWGGLDPATPDALAVARSAFTEPTEHGWLAAVEATTRLHEGSFDVALRLATGVLDEPATTCGPRALARSTMAHLLAATAGTALAVAELTRIDADAPAWRAEAPYVQVPVELARGTTLLLAGELTAVDALARAEFARLAETGDFALGSGYLMLLRAQAARMRGQLAEAVQLAAQAGGLLSAGAMYAGLAHAERAHAAALMGDAALAAEAMAEADRRHRPTMAVLYPWIEQARAWVAVAGGDRARGVAILEGLIERLCADGLFGHELLAQLDLARLGAGRAAAERMPFLTGFAQGALVQPIAWYARAVAEQDGAALLIAVDDFIDLGMELVAAEAATAAVTLLRRVRANATPVAAEKLAKLLARCPDARTPALDVRQPTLTGRERQIARLAAAGLSSKEIADRLYLSSRTVDNHLMRVYAKLGVSGRAALASALRTIPVDDGL